MAALGRQPLQPGTALLGGASGCGVTSAHQLRGYWLSSAHSRPRAKQGHLADKEEASSVGRACAPICVGHVLGRAGLCCHRDMFSGFQREVPGCRCPLVAMGSELVLAGMGCAV